MTRYMREPMNVMTHLFGAFFAVIGLILLITKAVSESASALTFAAVMIFGISMILLYAASSTYHMVIARKEVIAFLRKLDHSMIFILIAGTYTPFCLITLQGVAGWSLFIVAVAVATLGICFKLIWFHAPRWISTGLYLAMGWMIVFVFPPLAKQIDPYAIILLLIGGISYTIGAVIYATKPKWIESKYLGFHEIFHLFVLLGTFSHFLAVYFFVL